MGVRRDPPRAAPGIPAARRAAAPREGAAGANSAAPGAGTTDRQDGQTYRGLRQGRARLRARLAAQQTPRRCERRAARPASRVRFTPRLAPPRAAHPAPAPAPAPLSARRPRPPSRTCPPSPSRLRPTRGSAPPPHSLLGVFLAVYFRVPAPPVSPFLILLPPSLSPRLCPLQPPRL